MNDVSNPGPAAASVAGAAASDPPPSPSPPERKRSVWVWLLRAAILLGVVALFVAAAVFIQRWVKGPTLASDNSDVADQWLATIGRVGIDAIYPPQEDVLVGDVIIKVSGDNEPKASSQGLVGKSVHVARLDMTKELQQAYGTGYIFPDTAPKPQADGTPWPQQAAPASIFAPGVERKHLPLVILPGFTIARVRQAAVGGGWLSKAFSAAGAVEGEGESTVELKIPMAESYGIPFLVAKQRLDDFCNDAASRKVCTQEGARDVLLSNVGAEATDRVSCPKAEKGKPPPPCDPEESRSHRLNVQILLVYRVFLTRSIETVTRNNSSFGAQAKVAVKVGEELRQLQAAAPPSPAPNASPAEIAAARRALDAHKARLDALVAQLSSSPGATASLHSADSNSVSITQTLQRPVVIGYYTAMRIPEYAQ